MATAVIFGASGQTGTYLAELLVRRGYEVIKSSRTTTTHSVNIADFVEVERLIAARRPDLIFHLAARSTTRHEALFENHDAIATGTLNVLEAVKRHVPGAHVFITGSGVQFANISKPINEETPFEASSPYSIARIQSVYAARYYRQLGLATYVGYLFHHESPLRPPNHVSQKVARAACAIASGKATKLELGDLAVTKEWTYAGDVAEAAVTLLAQNQVFEAVIGSGEGHTIEEWVKTCFSIVGLDWREHVSVIPGFVPEYRFLVSDPRRILNLGWKPRTSFSELANLMMRGAHSQTSHIPGDSQPWCKSAPPP
jgi:GDPmannose 4,6-dehydratase